MSFLYSSRFLHGEFQEVLGHLYLTLILQRLMHAHPFTCGKMKLIWELYQREGEQSVPKRCSQRHPCVAELINMYFSTCHVNLSEPSTQVFWSVYLVGGEKYSADNYVNLVLTQLNLLFLYSWALLHLTMVKLVLHNVKNFFPIAGLEFTGMLNAALHCCFLYNGLLSDFAF